MNTMAMARELMKNCAPEGMNIEEISNDILKDSPIYFGALVIVNPKVPKPEFFGDMQSCIMEQNMVRWNIIFTVVKPYKIFFNNT